MTAETSGSLTRRRRVVAATAVTGAGLLGVSLTTGPDSRKFYTLTLGVASVWTTGGLMSGPLHLGHRGSSAGGPRRPVFGPIATGVAAFGAFYSGALVARRIPVLDRALHSVLQYAHEGSDRSVMLTTLANGVAEEVFFRGALYAAIGPRRPVVRSTAVYVAATSTTRNPALVLASVLMGLLFSAQRRATGGIQASTLTHLTWSALMIRFLPPLFRHGPDRRRPRG